jgi:hypothetical protein
MWTSLGLLLLVLASALIGYWLATRAWRGQPRDGYECKLLKNKGALIGVEVGVRTRTALDFELKHEGRIDRAAKAIGLSVEAQLGRPRIDEALYLVADVPRVASALRADTELVEALHALFAPSLPEVRKVARVVCRDGVVVLKVMTQAKGEDGDRIAAALAPPLRAIGARLASAHPGTPAPDPLRWRVLAVLAIASGLLVHGLLDAFRIVLDFDHTTLDPAKLWWLTLPVAAAVLLMLGTLTVALLGRSSRAHLVLVQAMLLGVAGVPFGAFAELRDLNMEADTSPREPLVVQVTGKRVHHGSKGGKSYYVALSGWPAQPAGYELQVRGDDFDRFLYQHDVTLVQRRGYLGIPWLESVTPAAP